MFKSQTLYKAREYSKLFSIYFYFQGGNIFVYTGMLELCSNDDQLGIVMSHEISHAILQHVVKL